MRRSSPPTKSWTRAAAAPGAEEQVEGYSLNAQQRATSTYCAAHGWEVIREYRDEGKSAWNDDLAKRPAFSRMIDDAEAGLVDVVVVHKLDRFSRNLMVTLETLHRLKAAGVGFVSISESIDFTNPIGQVVLATLAAFAEYYSANLSAETKKGKAERKKQGLYNGHLSFGTAKGADGVPVSHPEDHAALVQAFELAAAGKTDREVAQALNAAGYRTNGNRGANPFSKDTVRVILQNRFYLGELPDGNGGSVPGKHEAVIDPELFARVQAARLRNLKPRWTKTATRSPWALSGIAICGRCGKPIVADGHRRVCCAGRSQGNGCTEPSYLAHVVEDQMHAYLAGFAVPEAEQARLLAAWRRSHRQGTDTAAERRRLEQTRDRVKELYLAGAIDPAEYEDRTRAAEGELSLLPTGTETGDGAGLILAGFLADVPAAWAAATPDERNRLARQLFGQVVIANRTAVAVVPRPDLRPFFESLGSNGRTLTEPAEVTGVRFAGASYRRGPCGSRPSPNANGMARRGVTPTSSPGRAGCRPTRRLISGGWPLGRPSATWPPYSASPTRRSAKRFGRIGGRGMQMPPNSPAPVQRSLRPVS